MQLLDGVDWDPVIGIFEEWMIDLGYPTRIRYCTEILRECFHNPNLLREALSGALGLEPDDLLIVGPLDRRVVLARQDGNRWSFCSFTEPLNTLPWPRPDFRFSSSRRLQSIEVPTSALNWLTSPKVGLVALYHPENFPIPRYPLGIGDICRALRKQMIGSACMHDMQVGETIRSIATELEQSAPDIIGISATFGQDDVLNDLLDELGSAFLQNRLLVFGGSLCALNADGLIERYPTALVAKGPGEKTMQDIVRYWHGEIRRESITDVLFRGSLARNDADDSQSARVRTIKFSNPQYAKLGIIDDLLPELDLLPDILDSAGVMQLESSRGCTYACSFCPREHKGMWHGDEAENLHKIMPMVREIYNRYSHISKKMFLVDEEFVGYRPEGQTVARCLDIANTLRAYGYSFETNSRVDQVVRERKGIDWNINRIGFWRKLVDSGLERCLFGVESGVDSILKRFRKKTTATQNARAIRTLTLLGVPIRFTYITFDQLMSLEELKASYEFQGREDLILKKADHLTNEEIFAIAEDDELAKEYSSRRPFYSDISYMLVTMECLLGSPYLAEVESKGLANEVHYSMGRRSARFLDPRIGSMSDACQRWIDRNFSLDYTLKSIEKFSGRNQASVVREMRTVLKRSGYELLGAMLEVVGSDLDGASGTQDHFSRYETIMNERFEDLKSHVFNAVDAHHQELTLKARDLLNREVARWSQRDGWQLINAA